MGGKKLKAALLFVILAFLVISYVVYNTNTKTSNLNLITNSVVNVVANDNSSTSEGTGFAIEPNKILTCYHVIKYAKNILLRDKNGSEVNAKVLAYDSMTDLAILETQASFSPLPIKYEAPKIKSKVLVAHQGLIEEGTIIGNNLYLPKSPVNFLRLLKIFGPKITYGSSGGPVFNTKGEVIGMITSKLEEKNETYTFAIPLGDVEKVLNQIKLGKTFKYKELGINVQEISNESNNSSLVIVDTYQNSPAYMKLFAKDLIINFNEFPVYTIEDLRYYMFLYSDLKVWKLTVNRNGKILTVNIEVPENLNTKLWWREMNGKK